MKTISILGSTGSIGRSALDVIKLHSDKFKVFALSGHENIDLLFNLSLEFNPSDVFKTEVSFEDILIIPDFSVPKNNSPLYSVIDFTDSS